MENDKKQNINTPTAIIVAGVLIMIAILATNGGGKLGNSSENNKNKTLSEQVGVSKEKLTACTGEIDKEALSKEISDSVEKAMKALPADQRGTPYSIVIGKNGSKAEIRGADSIDNVRKLIDEVKAGKVTEPYKGEVPDPTESDHIVGNLNAPIIIVEYSDYECPFCKSHQSTLKTIVEESDGQVAWVYRHWPIHQNSFEKLVAAECVSKIKGNDAFWKYTDLLFGLLKTEPDPVSDQL